MIRVRKKLAMFLILFSHYSYGDIYSRFADSKIEITANDSNMVLSYGEEVIKVSKYFIRTSLEIGENTARDNLIPERKLIGFDSKSGLVFRANNYFIKPYLGTSLGYNFVSNTGNDGGSVGPYMKAYLGGEWQLSQFSVYSHVGYEQSKHFSQGKYYSLGVLFRFH